VPCVLFTNRYLWDRQHHRTALWTTKVEHITAFRLIQYCVLFCGLSNVILSVYPGLLFRRRLPRRSSSKLRRPVTTTRTTRSSESPATPGSSMGEYWACAIYRIQRWWCWLRLSHSWLSTLNAWSSVLRKKFIITQLVKIYYAPFINRNVVKKVAVWGTWRLVVL